MIIILPSLFDRLGFFLYNYSITIQLTMAQLYRIEELTTEGWTLVDNSTTQLTKEQCDEKLNWYVQTGNVNPNRLRAVPDA